eukprot:347903-Hanusia_phi.AAC.2
MIASRSDTVTFAANREPPRLRARAFAGVSSRAAPASVSPIMIFSLQPQPNREHDSTSRSALSADEGGRGTVHGRRSTVRERAEEASVGHTSHQAHACYRS